MHWIDMIGYLAAALMFSTFYMKKMIPLRAIGICSNITFIVFASYKQVYPLLVLHCALLPLNTIRMIQMMRLINRVKESSKGDMSMDFLVPYMTRESFKKGEILFKKDDDANKVYYLRKGIARVMEFDAYIKEGELLGEIGIFSRDKKRTASIICETDCHFLSIPDKQILQLYYQNPTFGIFLVQLIVQRFKKDVERDTLVERQPQRLTLKPDPAINFTEEAAAEE